MGRGGLEKIKEEKKKRKGYVLPEGRIVNKTHPDSCPAGLSGPNWPTESLYTFVLMSSNINNLTATLLTIQQLACLSAVNDADAVEAVDRSAAPLDFIHCRSTWRVSKIHLFKHTK